MILGGGGDLRTASHLGSHLQGAEELSVSCCCTAVLCHSRELLAECPFCCLLVGVLRLQAMPLCSAFSWVPGPVLGDREGCVTNAFTC